MKNKFNPADSVPKASDYIDTDNIQPITPEQREAFKESDAYKKYVRPAIERDKSFKRSKRVKWLFERCLPVLNTIFALIAAITGVCAILLQLNLL